MPAGCDAEVATLFRDLRVASNLTETDLAARIATPVEVVQALEQGALYALPPWPETCRVVNAYGTMLNLDTGPLLRRIYAQLEAGIVELGPKATPDVPVMVPPGSGNFALGQPIAAAAPAPQAMPQAPLVQASPQQAPAQQAPLPNGQPQPIQPQAVQPPPIQPPAPSGQAAWPGGVPPLPQGGVAGLAQPAPVAPPAPLTPGYSAPGVPGEPQAMPGGDALMGEPEAEPKSKKPALLKWGLSALIASVILVGLWMALGDSSDPMGSSDSSSGSNPVLDPDDPRSRKADRLPDNF